jgi:hypothetical protein
MGGNDLGSRLRTTREQANDLLAQRVLETVVFNRSEFGLAKAAPRPLVLVSQAVGFCPGECLFFNKNALALVAAPGATESHHDCGESALLLRPPGKCRVTGGQEHQIIEIRTLEAEGCVILHEQQITGVAALRADPRLERRDDDQIGRSAPLLG